MSKHLKRFFSPKSWNVKVKGIKFITKPSPGTHKIKFSMPLDVILRDILNYADTKREVKLILNKGNVLVDGIPRKDHRFPVGLFDVLSILDLKLHFRMVLDKKGKLNLIKIDEKESMLKLCKVTGKSIVKSKVQLNLFDGKNIIVEKEGYKLGDALLITLGKKNAIKEHIKLEKNIMIYLTGGKHIGQTGKVQDIIGNRILYKTESGEFVETLKEHVFPVGKEKIWISLTN
jgi:small subunit ribosomal protein S4e